MTNIELDEDQYNAWREVIGEEIASEFESLAHSGAESVTIAQALKIVRGLI
jgi:hypothetical protein